jgi:hypothetical protein
MKLKLDALLRSWADYRKRVAWFRRSLLPHHVTAVLWERNPSMVASSTSFRIGIYGPEEVVGNESRGCALWDTSRCGTVSQPCHCAPTAGLPGSGRPAVRPCGRVRRPGYNPAACRNGILGLDTTARVQLADGESPWRLCPTTGIPRAYNEGPHSPGWRVAAGEPSGPAGDLCLIRISLSQLRGALR